MSDEGRVVTGLENLSGVETAFSECISILTDSVEDDLINRLASIADELLLVRYCHLSMLVPVPELTFSVTVGSTTTIPMIMVPFDWLSKSDNHLREQTASVLRVCSLLVDYYNDRYMGNVEECLARADVLEAQLYLVAGWRVYSQRLSELRDRYPHGKHSGAARHLLYMPKPFFSLRD